MKNNSPSGVGGKQILLIRHAKSSWEDFSQKDFDRPLNERGKKDARQMAKRLKEKEILIDTIVSSPAKRAINTANFFAEAFDIKKKNIIQIPAFYEPVIEAFYNAIINLDNDDKTVALFSHNPTITAFANQLTKTQIDDMPTCSVFALRAAIKTWNNFKQSEKEFWFFDYPKNIS